VDQLLPPSPPADLAGLAELNVDARQGRKIDDRAPAHLLPKVGKDEKGAEPCRIGEQGFGLPAQGDRDLVDQPVLRDESGEDGHDDDRRDEAREAAHALHQAPHGLHAQLIQKQDEQNGGRKADEDQLQAQDDGILENVPESRIGKELADEREADPPAS